MATESAKDDFRNQPVVKLRHTFNPSLLRVCKQIHDEYREVAFRDLRVIVRFDNDMIASPDRYALRNDIPRAVITSAKQYVLAITYRQLSLASARSDWAYLYSVAKSLRPEQRANMQRSPAKGKVTTCQGPRYHCS